jgi:enediyne biosynthesis protein E4
MTSWYRRIALAAALTAASTSFSTPADSRDETSRARLAGLQREALTLLKQLAEPNLDAATIRRLRTEAAERIEALVTPSAANDENTTTADRALIPVELREELRRAAAELRAKGALTNEPRTAPDAQIQLLERVGARLATAPLGLDFLGSYAQTKKAEPVYGGHSSAVAAPSMDSASPVAVPAQTSAIEFIERAELPVKTYCGGPTKDHILESGGSGVALFDYDNDGRLDIYVVTAFELTADRKPIAHKNALFHNLGDWKFEDVSAASGTDVAAWGNGVCAGDYDNDGLLDLYVTNFGPNFLFKNRGNGHFEDVATSAGVQASGWSTGCAFFDADGDGDLDLYVAHYVSSSWEELAQARRTLTWRGGPQVMVGPMGLPGEADQFFENRGNGTFVEASVAHGLADTSRGYGFGVLATDYDDDGRVDLFVANDTSPNFLYHNVGGGRFESQALATGVALNASGRAQAGMGVDAGDYDGDGRLDLVLTTFAHDSNTLFRNVSATAFDDVTTAAGLAAPTFERMGWGVAWLDADLDGDLDLFFANGHIYPDVDRFPDLHETFKQKNQILQNDSGRFSDVSASAGAGLLVQKASRGLAVGDLDGDGDLDAVITNLDDTPTLLENRQHTGHHWIAFRLEHAGKNRFAIGARVTVESAGRRQVREVRSGGSYLSQSDLRPNFGLGSYAGTVDVEVRLSGERWRFTGLATDRLHVLQLNPGNRLALNP